MTVIPKEIRQAGTPAEQRFLDLYAQVSNNLPGATIASVKQWREAAIDTFATLGLPHRRVEEFKYTDLRTLMPEVLPLAGVEPKASDVSVEAAIGPELAAVDAYRAVFINGQFRSGLSTITQEQGFEFISTRVALSEKDTIDKYEPALASHEGDAIFAMASAFATDGAILNVKPGTQLAKPLHLIVIGSGSSPTLSSLYNMICVGEDADITLIETKVGMLPGQMFEATQIYLKPNAKVQHVRITAGKGGKRLSSFAVGLGQGAQYDPTFIGIDGALTRTQGKIRFEGEQGRAHFTGGMLLRGSDHGDFTLVVDHAVPHCESRELVKVVLDDRARGVFQAKVLVRPDAQKTDGKQMSNALLLSDEAEFDAKPELEIYADDVVCGHGATAGQLDDDMMFYLKARGIPENEARALLIAAFIGEALDKITHEPLRDAVQARVDAWLKVMP